VPGHAPKDDDRYQSQVERTFARAPMTGRYHRRVDATSTPLVRPALELACAVAKAGERLSPPLSVPRPMRPLMRFSRLPDRALDVVRQVLDEDDEFRLRVSAVANEKAIGRLPWLWLVRPDGWEEEIDSAAVESEARSQDDEDRRADRTARRRLSVVEASLQRSEIELVEARAASAALGAELGELRQQRRSEAEAAARDRAARTEAIEARTAAERRAEEAEAARSDLEARLVAADRDRSAAEAALARLAGQLEAAQHGLSRAGQERDRSADRSAATAAALGESIGAAATAAAALGAALGRASELLEGSARTTPVGRPTAPPPRPAVNGAGSGKGEQGAPEGGGPRRRPVRLPAAVFDDSSDAAAWLVRVPGVVVIVDGYNITLAAWPGQDLPDQRHRLVSALAELSMRSGAEVEVVFDGADDHAHPLRSLPARRPVRIAFSPPSVDADEIIIERVALLPASRPVVVATNDRRVRDEVRRLGANVVSTEQLVAVLGRSFLPGRP
jgi:predicted RNA-binding protein with PIN domain